MNMTEEWIYFFWNTRNFNHNQLCTTDAQLLEIRQYGIRNKASGPDFVNAAIRLDDLIWHGNVEMHVLTSDWQKHGHQKDEAYENVILHVVWQHDWDPTQGRVPILELSSRVDASLWERCAKVLSTPNWLPCETLLSADAMARFDIWKDSLVTARLFRKLEAFERTTTGQNLDWDAKMHRLLCMYLSGKDNRACGEQLSMRLPLSIIDRNQHNPLSILAMVLGVAGCLEDVPDEGFRLYLSGEFAFFERKYSLSSIKRSAWRRFGMRAAGMPVRRLSQLAAILSIRTRFQGEVTQSKTAAELIKILDFSLPDDERWRKLLPQSQLLTRETKEMLVLNVFLPLWFSHASELNRETKDRVLFDILQALPPEKNQITEKFKKLGFQLQSALDSQALLELRSQYCLPKRCASCSVGQFIFTNGQ